MIETIQVILEVLILGAVVALNVQVGAFLRKEPPAPQVIHAPAPPVPRAPEPLVQHHPLAPHDAINHPGGNL